MPDNTSAHPARPEPTYFLIGGQVMTVGHPLTCVARTTAGVRCKNPMEYGEQNGTWRIHEGTGLQVYDVGDGQRWPAQHCPKHDAPDTPDHWPPQWQPYDPRPNL